MKRNMVLFAFVFSIFGVSPGDSATHSYPRLERSHAETWTALGISRQQPTLYPGAVPLIAGEETGFDTKEQYSVSVYLTKDGYTQVKTYYVNENTEPRREDDRGERGITAFFSYVRRMPDDVGVAISERTGNSRVPEAIFSNLRGLAIQGVIPQERVNEIVQKYGYLERCYFVHEKDEKGEVVPVDKIIQRKYEAKLGLGRAEPVDKEEIMTEAEKLMKEGKMREYAELMKKLQQDQIAALELAISADAVDVWVECLEELASHAYNVKISIQL